MELLYRQVSDTIGRVLIKFPTNGKTECNFYNLVENSIKKKNGFIQTCLVSTASSNTNELYSYFVLLNWIVSHSLLFAIIWSWTAKHVSTEKHKKRLLFCSSTILAYFASIIVPKWRNPTWKLSNNGRII